MKTIEQKIDELFDDLPIVKNCWNLRRVIKNMLEGYSDSHDDIEQKRELVFQCVVSVDGFWAKEITRRCIKSYNEFDVEAIESVVDYFGNHAEYFLGRESSVCVHVKPQKRIWLDRQKLCAKQDEFSVESDGRFRIWWD